MEDDSNSLRTAKAQHVSSISAGTCEPLPKNRQIPGVSHSERRYSIPDDTSSSLTVSCSACMECSTRVVAKGECTTSVLSKKCVADRTSPNAPEDNCCCLRKSSPFSTDLSACWKMLLFDFTETPRVRWTLSIVRIYIIFNLWMLLSYLIILLIVLHNTVLLS